MVETNPVICAVCGRDAKKVGDEYECPICKKIFWTSPQKQICCECGCLFLDFKGMANRLQNWIGITNRNLWKNLCPKHRRESFYGMGTVCEVIQQYVEEGYTPRDFDLPEELVKLCLSRRKIKQCALATDKFISCRSQFSQKFLFLSVFRVSFKKDIGKY